MKLTTRQREILGVLNDEWTSEYAIFKRAWRAPHYVDGPTTAYSHLAALVKRELAERNNDQGYARWRITDAGKAARA